MFRTHVTKLSNSLFRPQSQLASERPGRVDEDAGGGVVCLHPVFSSERGFSLDTICCPRIPCRRTLLQRVPGFTRVGQHLRHVQLLHQLLRLRHHVVTLSSRAAQVVSQVSQVCVVWETNALNTMDLVFDKLEV